MSAQKILTRADKAGSGTAQREGEITFSDSEFNQVRALIQEMTGINMGVSKRQLLYRRVVNRLKARNISSVSDYLEILRSGDAEEIEQFTNAVTTNLTSFFRENHHFEFLANSILPEVMESKARSDRRLRIWSAGCSTGEEPYSLAMTLRESFPDLASWNAKILCTDLDTNVVTTAAAGVYGQNRVEKIPQKHLKKWFKQRGDQFEASKELKSLLTFKQLNLMGNWPMSGKFDVIFCRNVIIYFDKPTQRVLMKRYAELLEDGGYLILGHSESLFKVSDQFELIGKTIYQKKVQ